ncbi:DNA polymerase III subunit delta [Cucumibacter marinus]|uniref:DNA polymerase III subunit delta n=1 Tax=Cucumibacter marinus TaxID=1121252 RepID=UPI000402DC6F|nr:DNA polymerase III subunit delta [Cucumibacter marinus]
MTALKGKAIENFVARPDLAAGVMLAYGPDAGLVRELADRLVAAFSRNGDTDLVNLHFADIDSDPGQLAVEAKSVSLFGGSRIIRLRGAGNPIAPVLEQLLDEGLTIPVIVEAGSLTPRDGLRKLAEKHAGARALPCYADNAQALNQLVLDTFRQHEIAIDNDAVQALRDILGNDRAITRSELEKLTLYAAETKRVTREDVITLCGDNAALALDQIADAVGTGHAEKLDDAFNRALASGMDVAAILAFMQNHFSGLRAMRRQFDAGTAPAQLVRSGRIHFSRSSAVETQIRSWSDRALSKAGERIRETTAITRTQPDLAVSATRHALLSLSVMAARL